MNAFTDPITPPSEEWRKKGAARMARLTMPPGACGDLLSLATRLISIQQTLTPSADRFAVVPFCADHGLYRPEITNSPRQVTALVAANMARGTATVARLTALFGGTLHPQNMGICHPLPDGVTLPGPALANHTTDFTLAPAMTDAQCEQALNYGAALARRLAKDNDLLAAGEMGVGNTTAAAALFCHLEKSAAPEAIVGLGSGINEEKRTKKIAVVKKALALHGDAKTPLQALARLGGFELAAMTGFYLGAAAAGKGILLDGFLTAVTACYAAALNPAVKGYLFASHLGAEQGHAAALRWLELTPPLHLGLKLGEGAGATLLVPLLRAACTVATLPTFEESGVPEGIPEEYL